MMIRRSSNAVFSFRSRAALEAFKKCWLSSDRTSSSPHIGAVQSRPLRQSGYENRLVPSFLVTSGGLGNDPQLSTRDKHQQIGCKGLQWLTTEQLATSPRPTSSFNSVPDNCHVHPIPMFGSDRRWCIESPRITRVVGYNGAECSLSGVGACKAGRNRGMVSTLLDPWKGSVLRLLSTEAKVPLGSDNSKEKNTKANAEARPKSIEDFKHEEIEGPTVERDESDTANELRGSAGELRTFMDKLSTAFIFLGSVQLVATIWSWYIHAGTPVFRLAHDLAFLLSFVLLTSSTTSGRLWSFFQD